MMEVDERIELALKKKKKKQRQNREAKTKDKEKNPESLLKKRKYNKEYYEKNRKPINLRMNKYTQMRRKKRRILFVCTSNKDRSRTAVEVLKHYLTLNKPKPEFPKFLFRSAGINKYFCQKALGVHVSELDLNYFGKIICFEKIHVEYILKNHKKVDEEKIICWDFGDTESYMSESLQKGIIEKFKQTDLNTNAKKGEKNE